MPELPEVETIRRGLAPAVEGATIVRAELRRPDLRFPFPDGFAETLGGRTIVALRRRAKYLIADLDTDLALVMHLGMSGSFRIRGGPDSGRIARHFERFEKPDHDHVLIHLSTGADLIYNDPRRFGFMSLVPRTTWQAHPYFARLGPEPTGNELSAASLVTQFAARTAPLKSMLLDQTVVAGLGNIYVCEALWRARLLPQRAAASLVRRDGKASVRLQRLVDGIRAVIADAIEAGGSTIRDFVHADGSLGYFQHRFSVYDREDQPCQRPGCRGIVRRVIQSGRSSFYCPACQR